MKKTLIRAISFFLTLSLLTGLLIPFASAIEYEGVESMTVDATAALLIDLDTDQVLYEQAADEQRYPASITKILTALIVIESCDLDEIVTFSHDAVYNVEADSSSAGPAPNTTRWIGSNSRDSSWRLTSSHRAYREGRLSH